MNRILFIPLNKQLLYFYLRALAKGHLAYFKWNPGNVRKGFRSENFVDHRELMDYQMDLSRFDYQSHLYWYKYLGRKKISHVVTNVEDNKIIIDCLRVAREFGIKISYIMHGGGKIYDYDFQKEWYTSGIYDYFYAKDEYTKDYIGDIGRKFTRKMPNIYCKKDCWRKPKKVMFVPSQTSPEWYLEGSGVLLNNDRKHDYQRDLLHWMKEREGVEFLWCHNPERDAMPNKMVPYLQLLDGGNVEWARGKPSSYFNKVDAAITDVGSSFFFEAIRAGVPVLCLHYFEKVPFKKGTIELFGECVKVFASRDPMKQHLDNFITSNMIRYVPAKYICAEQKPNDSLVWEER